MRKTQSRDTGISGLLAVRALVRPSGMISPAALSALVAKSQGGKFGARDLRRVIRKAVEDPAAERIIDGTLKAGGSLTVDAENGEVILK